MKKIKTYFNKTSIIDNIEIQTGGLTLQDVVDKYGKELNADAMEELATTGKHWDIMINLTPGASYTLVVEATNNYGKKKTDRVRTVRDGHTALYRRVDHREIRHVLRGQR